MDNIDLDSVKQLYQNCKTEYEKCTNNYDKIRMLRKQIYELECLLLSKCKKHTDFDRDLFDKYNEIKYIYMNNDGSCLLCGLPIRMMK